MQDKKGVGQGGGEGGHTTRFHVAATKFEHHHHHHQHTHTHTHITSCK